ncbi:urease accessory protein UreF [Agaricicola taiwanensis]|nr:urease accessory protein UreF [Agaricicola taiwanensis]
MVTDTPHLLPLMAWLSPAFPVGGYAYSHGLEWAVECGDVSDEASLTPWLLDFLTLGAGRTDAILLAHVHRAGGDAEVLREINDLALALSPSSELHLETSQQGTSFLAAIKAAWPCDGLDGLAGPIAYPVAVGLAAGRHGLPVAATVEAFLFGVTQNLVSAGVRLAPIGQTGGTRVLAALGPTIRAVGAEALAADLDAVGGCTFRADLGSFFHETQYTRLFRS